MLFQGTGPFSLLNQKCENAISEHERIKNQSQLSLINMGINNPIAYL